MNERMEVLMTSSSIYSKLLLKVFSKKCMVTNTSSGNNKIWFN